MAEPIDAEPTEACSECGARVAGGTDGCRELFEAEQLRAYADPAIARHWRLTVDCYSLQHPLRHCVSAVSTAAHLTGLAAAMERPDEVHALNDRAQRWLSTRPDLTKPELPADRGDLTIMALRDAPDPPAHDAAIGRWATVIWAAHASLHDVAREWIEAAEADGGART